MFGGEYFGLLALFGHVLVPYVLLDFSFGFEGYAAKHCKYCGKNLRGSDYSYEEYEREMLSHGSTRSSVEFHFYCAECGEDNARYEKMSTNKKKIDKHARKIVGRK